MGLAAAQPPAGVPSRAGSYLMRNGAALGRRRRVISGEQGQLIVILVPARVAKEGGGVTRAEAESGTRGSRLGYGAGAMISLGMLMDWEGGGRKGSGRGMPKTTAAGSTVSAGGWPAG